MAVESLLGSLHEARKTGPGRWLARCPAHNDKTPSLAVRELEDGRVLLHCFAGCGAGDVLYALGMDFGVLFPEGGVAARLSKVPKAYNAADVLAAVAYEILVGLHYAKKMVGGSVLGQPDLDRLLKCAARLQKALEVVRG